MDNVDTGSAVLVLALIAFIILCGLRLLYRAVTTSRPTFKEIGEALGAIAALIGITAGVMCVIYCVTWIVGFIVNLLFALLR